MTCELSSTLSKLALLRLLPSRSHPSHPFVLPAIRSTSTYLAVQSELRLILGGRSLTGQITSFKITIVGRPPTGGAIVRRTRCVRCDRHTACDGYFNVTDKPR